jgi:hypothetical protein
LRWILYLPVVILLPLIIAFILRLVSSQLMPDWRRSPITNFVVFVIGAYLAVVVFFPMVFAFAPRGKKIAGWCFYVPLMLWSAISLVLLVGRRLATWGLLGDALRPPEGLGWEARYWAKLGQAVVWLVAGTIVFRERLRVENALARTRPHASTAGS